MNISLEYYGSSPSDYYKYYKSITKDYHTEDGFYVKIDSGNITISKKITNILTVTYRDRFYEATSFSVFHCSFVYDSGRCIQWSHQRQELAEKHANQFQRFEEILQSEQVWNPFIGFGNYISFIDFYKKDIT